MDANLLVTKFHLPQPCYGLVMRPSLIEKLSTGIAMPLSVVVAPAGFGKTTAVIQWIGQALPAAYADRVAWLSLDERDNTLSLFWTYVVGTLQSLVPQIGKVALNALQSSPAPPIENILITLINDLAAETQPLLLCLDDYHLISNPKIHHSLEFFIDHLPQNFHLILTTREDPPFSLARLRVRRQINEIRASDLRFSEAESAQFFNEITNLGLAPADIHTLNQRTEGWVAGLQLAALSLQGTPNRQAFVADFAGSHRFLTDYLVDEVLSRQSQPVQTFLYRTSLLARFNAEICDQLMEDVNSRTIINQLEQANLFIVPLDNQRHWYRYHHLFAEFLQIHLQEKEADRIPDLYARIIAWFSAQGFKREALQYAMKANEIDKAADLIEELAPEILAHDNHMLLCEWVEALPSHVIEERPFLCSYLAWASLIATDPETAQQWLDQAQAHTDHSTETQATTLQAYLTAHQAYIPLLQGNTHKSIQLAQQALQLLPDDEISLRARTLTVLGNAYIFSGNLKEASEVFEETILLANQTGDLSSAMFAYFSLADLLRVRCRYQEAKARLQEALELSRALAGSIQIPLNASIFKQLGVVSRECGKLEIAIEYFNQSVNLAREWQQNEPLLVSLIELADTTRLMGDYAQAEQYIQQGRSIARTISPWTISMVDAFQARLFFAQGKVEAMQTWAEKASLLDKSLDLDFERFPDFPALIRLHLTQDAPQTALQLIEKLIQQEIVTGRLTAVGYMLGLQVLAYRQLGQKEAAQRAFDELYEIAAPENWVRPFLEDRETMLPYLQNKPASPQRDYILKALGETPAPEAPTPDQSALIEPLNERELTVLRQISGGCSNREIGEQMFLSVNTVRWYASQIYLKLGVKNRTEAVAKARELDIL